MLNRRRFIHQVSGGAAALAGSSVFPPASILGANDRVRFGLIGAGGRGLDIFKHALRAPNSQAIAVADVYTRRLEEAKQLAPTVQTFTDFRRLLDDKSIDAVLIATPQHQHALNFVPAIQAGKDVYQEKTMALNPDHARRMRRAVEGSNRVVQVGVQSVSGKTFARARELTAPDSMGTITAIHTHHYRNRPYGGWKRSIPPDCNLDHVAWKEFEGEARPHEFDPQRFINWRFFWDYSASKYRAASRWPAITIFPPAWKFRTLWTSPWTSRKISCSLGTRRLATITLVRTDTILRSETRGR